MSSSGSYIKALKESRRGIQCMIETRLRDIQHLLMYYKGNEARFIKPPQDRTRIEIRCLTLRREVKRLRVIKAEINLIIQLKELQYA